MISVLIVDDHQLLRQGIRALLERVEDMHVVGEAADGDEATQLAQDLKPDVVVMDISMPGTSGLEACAAISASTDSAIVVLSMHVDNSIVNRALENGALGYVLKESAADELLLAIRAASRGSTYLGRAASTSIRTPSVRETDRGPSDVGLTQREREVLALIAAGLTNRAIGSKLGISMKTVERHRANLMAKLDAHTVVEVIRLGVKKGLITMSEDTLPETDW